ncbi:tubulin alpha chain [Phytophthora nicotianae P1569]|uniref:Tubulin alpha chain n=1 Tax=Phytophthora nicotianae P1569 TaxID=1317065 RepID=V9FRR8_PHYNI|nr:tubulin alpha chain [Phytophthora nicotianae P1569]
MARSPATPVPRETTRSPPSSPRQARASTCRVPCSWTWSPQCVTKSARAPTVSCTTRSRSSRARKTRPTTTRVATTRSERRSWTRCSIAFASLRILAPVCKVSWYLTPWAVAPVPDSDPYYSSVFRSTMVANANLVSRFTRHRCYLQQ